MEGKLKHLEFIQNVIARMNSNSFLIKGWAVTIVSALFALAAKDSNVNFAFVSYIGIPIFWIFDAFFVSQERQFRGLYEKVRTLPENEINFDMNNDDYDNNYNTWRWCLVSKTIGIFYLLLVSTTIIVTILLGARNG